MQEIQATSVQVKLSDGHEDQWVLIHNGQQVIEFAAPATPGSNGGGGGKIGTAAANTMLVGTKDELDAEIARLKLKPKRPRRPPDKTPPSQTPPQAAQS